MNAELAGGKLYHFGEAQSAGGTGAFVVVGWELGLAVRRSSLDLGEV